MQAVPKCIFVSNSRYLVGSGGVQWCSREYLETLRAAGFEPSLVTYEVDRSWTVRLKRRLFPSPFRNILPPDLLARVAEVAAHEARSKIFLNNAEVLPLAPLLKRMLPEAIIVYLSHGAEITDAVNNFVLSPQIPVADRPPTASWLGKLLEREIQYRRSLSGTVCISQPDARTESWLGSREIIFLPRQVAWRPLPARPVGRRVGCIATLNHGPNLHGIEVLAALLGNSEATLRLVGSPADLGEALQRRFRCLQYLGGLTDSELETEASTWVAFVNPIFCPARGASTKVATALGWGIPVLTTEEGARGYRWDRAALPLAMSPFELAVLVRKVTEKGGSSLREAEQVARNAPTLEEAAQMLKDFLEMVERAASTS